MMPEITFSPTTEFTKYVAQTAGILHIVLIATKPDIIKQIPIYKELRHRGHNVLLVHTGQHYDENLSGGMLKEFGVEPDVNLHVKGTLYEVVSQIILRFGYIIEQLKAGGTTVIPYVHGDTVTAMAASNAAYCHGFSCVHVEAGIRTLTARKDLLQELKRATTIDANFVARFQEKLLHRSGWESGSMEPIPEQFNTRCSEVASSIHLAPVALNRDSMLAEGFLHDRIAVVGNSVADATKDALAAAAHSTIFEKYPILQTGNFARFCIHRRENCMSKHRFTVIFNAMKQLIEEGRTVLLISLFQTEAAIDRFELRNEMIELAKKPNFIYSPVWPLYTDVIAAMSKAAVCVTDSGSMQEEMNVLQIPCVTLRFGSDRSESIMNGGNLLAPPMRSDFIYQSVLFAWDRPAMKQVPMLYGANVSQTCINFVEEVLRYGPMNRTEEERLGL